MVCEERLDLGEERRGFTKNNEKMLHVPEKKIGLRGVRLEV